MNPWLATAYHEAGHAVIAVALGLPLKSVTVSSRYGGLTVLRVPRFALTPDQDVVWTLAGPAAERRSGLSLPESPLAFQEQTHEEQARDVLAAHYGVSGDSEIVT